jgi:photosystem II stability/assembly factor-like uncharacterized protein
VISARATARLVWLVVVAAAAAPGGRAGAAASAKPVTSAAAVPSETPPPPPFAHVRWREMGPAVGGGRVTSVTGSARDSKLYYLGTAAGGVWRSQNGGATWAPVFEGEPVASIGAIAIDPTNDRTIWAGTGETNPRNDVTYGGGLYKSIDGAKTWTLAGLADTLQISSIAVDPRNPDTVVVGGMGDFFADSAARGIFRTTDGGKTWKQALYAGPRSGVSDIAMDPRDPRVVYAGVWEFRREPWTFTSGGADDGLYKSTDGGATWTKLTGHGLPEAPVGRIGLAIAPSEPKRVYALIESSAGVLWRSDDAGATWALASKDTLADQRPFYFSHITVDPDNPDHVYAVSERLAESVDGGKTFKETADSVHVDFHAMWIAPNDSTRMIVGEDGGYALTLDGGGHWSFARDLAIGQAYHVGYDDETPYRVCAPLQDNNAFCGPSNGLNPQGLVDSAWERVTGGDGMWAWPDPVDANLVWVDAQDGQVSVYDRTQRHDTPVAPYEGTSLETFDVSKARYRFNWNSPIAFSPWEAGTVWYGGDVVFQTRDRGAHWVPISPDLTKNDKAHQQPSGGPIAHDVSGAESTDTILDIEGSPLRRGEIWVGTDDGVVQLTRDGGVHWRAVTPAGVAADGRFEIVAPSPLVPGTAYAVDDRHLLGDRSPHAFLTHDWGATWRAIDTGLPAREPARSIRPDPRNPHLVYAGLEGSIWASWDDGAHWRSLQLNLPHAPVYDIRVQPRWNDLLVATHGRSLWAIDSLSSVQALPDAEIAGAAVFAPRPAYEFFQHAEDEELYTRYAGQNPPSGAILDFYQARAGPAPPTIDILDAAGRIVRRIAGTRRVGERDVPLVTNDPGINRVVWDLRENGPIRWMGAARDEYRGPRAGIAVVPGRYTVRVVLAGKTYTAAVVVYADPRAHLTQVQLRAAHDFYARELAEFSMVDAALNRLDSVAASASHALETASRRTDATVLSARLSAALDDARALRATLTADYHNDEDSLERPGGLREDLEDFAGVTTVGTPTAAVRDYAARLEPRVRAALRSVDAFFAGDVALTNADLRSAGMPALADIPNPPEPPPSPTP